MKKNIKKQGISLGTILIIITIFFILIKSIFFTKIQKNISSGEIQNVSSSDGITSQRGIILNVPIDSRPISRNNFEYLVKAAGYDYVEFNGYLDENELEWEIYKAGDSKAQRNEINQEFKLNGEKYNKSNNTMIINGSSYFFGGLVATSDPKAYENMETKIQHLKELVSTYNNIEYYVIFNIPRTLPDSRVLEYPEGMVDGTKVSGMEDYYNAEVKGETLEKKTYFNEAVTEWLYMRYYNKVKGGDTFSTWPYYVQKFCSDFYNEYSTFLEEYVLIFEESINYLEELLKVKQELKDTGKKDFTLIVTQNDVYISDFFTKNIKRAGSENFTMIEQYVNSQKIIKHSPTYYIESLIKNEDCILFPGVDEVNHMILARDLVKKTGKGMTFNYLNPKTNDSTISFMDYVGDYDPMSVRENLEMRESFINKFAAETSNVIDTYLTYREKADSAIMTEQEAEIIAQNIYNNPKSEKIIIGVQYFDPNLTRSLAKNGNIFDMTYCSEWNTVGNTLGIGLSSAVIGETLKNEVINIEDTEFLKERILNYAEYRVITVLEGLIYNPYRYPDLTKNPNLATYEEEKNDVTGKKLAERISYTGGNGKVDGEIFLIDNLLNGTNTNGERYKYSIGNFVYTVDSIDIVATRPWNRPFEVKLIPNMEILEVEKVEYKVQHYLEELDGTYLLNPDIEKFKTYPETEVMPEPKTYEGFTSPNKQKVRVEKDGSTVIKYYYTRNSYKVDIIHGVGIQSVLGDRIYKYEEQVELSGQPKQGYENIKWMNNDKQIVSSFKMPAENVRIKAQCEIINYTIKYNLNGGTAEGNPETYTIETEDIILRKPVKENYEFLGWTGSNGEEPEKEVTIKKGSIGYKEYTANWKRLETEYRIEHYLEELDGTYSLNSDIEKIKTCPETEVMPEPKTYEGFTSPNKQKVRVEKDGSTVIKYYYTRNSYKVEIVKGVGIQSISGDGIYKYEEQVEFSGQPKQGYENIKWMNNDKLIISSFKMPAENVSIKAQSEIINYKIEYNLNGGSVEGNPETYTIETEDIILAKPVKENYEFLGWTGSNGEEPEKEVTIKKGSIGKKDYIANWRLNEKSELELVVKYGNKDLTNENVRVEILANTKLEPINGWKLSENEMSISKEYTSNRVENIEVISKFGDKKQVTIEVKNIDKISPEIEIRYEYSLENNVVTVYIIASEEIQDLIDWKKEDGIKYTKQYNKNTTEQLIIKDLAGNETIKQVIIKQIKEKNEIKTEDSKEEIKNELNNDEDSTIVDKELPKAGKINGIMVWVLILNIVVGIILCVKCKKYKNI